jgi:hypothetical protein
VTRDRGLYHVSAVLRNVTAQRLEFEVPGPCPVCPVKFSGLPTGYKYDLSCGAGACPSPLTTLRYALTPGEEVEVGALDIDPVQTTCGHSVPPGRYQVNFTLPIAPASVRVCSRYPATVALNALRRVECPRLPPCPPTIPCF